jgi:hypothetical protein
VIWEFFNILVFLVPAAATVAPHPPESGLVMSEGEKRGD